MARRSSRRTSTSCSTIAAFSRGYFVRCSGWSARAGTCCRSASCSASASTPRPKSRYSASPPTQAVNGASAATILVFPALFAAGMTLIDTTDGVLMLGAYGWAFMKPVRKLYYNMTITAVSVVVAVVVGGLETLNLIGDRLGLRMAAASGARSARSTTTSASSATSSSAYSR